MLTACSQLVHRVESAGKPVLLVLKVRHKIGYMSQNSHLTRPHDWTKPRVSVVFGIPAQKASEEKLGTQMSDLVGREDMLTADLPGGWKQQVALAQR